MKFNVGNGLFRVRTTGGEVLSQAGDPLGGVGVCQNLHLSKICIHPKLTPCSTTVSSRLT